MERPIYNDARAATLEDKGNRGLWYTRFFDHYQADWTLQDEAKKDWVCSNAKPSGDRQQLDNQALRQLDLLAALGGHAAVFKTDWHFATGLGLPHPVENGLAWHPTLGVPYLAGSGVKGLVKAWVEVWDESLTTEADRTQRSERWFGTTAGEAGTAGAFLFFDALPIVPVLLTADVMTPHLGKWYEQGDELTAALEPERLPADWHDPVPVPFLVVKQAQLLFGIAPRRPEYAAELPDVMQALEQALNWLGAGAKTAAGYGQMQRDDTRLADLQQRLAARTKTPAQRELDSLRAQFENDQQAKRKEPGGELVTRLNQLLQADNARWSQAERQALAELATAVFGYLGWTKKMKEKKPLIARLYDEAGKT